MQSTLLDLAKGAPTHPRDLGHCLEFLSLVLDAVDDDATTRNQDAQQVCEHLFEMITDRGIWGPEDAESDADFIGLTPV